MATSVTQICNLAIRHIGIGNPIAEIDSDKTKEALACRTFYETARDKVLSDFNWPFATKIVDLALVEEDPNSEWAYSYRYPSECLNFRRILSGIRNDNRQSRIPYRIAQDIQGRLIFTDVSEAQAEYTVRIEDVSFFDPSFTLALSYLLAAYITPSVMGSDRFKMVPALLQMYQAELANAQAGAANEQQDEMVPESEFIRARDGVSDDALNNLIPF